MRNHYAPLRPSAATALILAITLTQYAVATNYAAVTRSQARSATQAAYREASAQTARREASEAAIRTLLVAARAERDIARAEAAAVSADNASLRARFRKPQAPSRVAITPKRQVKVKAHGSIPTLVRRIARAHGYGAGDVEALVTLCRRESTFRPGATNGSCKGLFQLKTRNPRWSDPAWNTDSAISYIERRYGSPRAALAHSYSRGWY